MNKHTLKTSFLTLSTLLCLGLGGLVSGCGEETQIDVPDNFVSLSDDRLYGDVVSKSVSADGAVIIVRERENEPAGSLKFWSDALSAEISKGRGYTLLKQGELKSDRSQEGTLMQFASTYNGTAYNYDVALYVLEDRLITVETTAPKAVFETHRDAFDLARKSVRRS